MRHFIVLVYQPDCNKYPSSKREKSIPIEGKSCKIEIVADNGYHSEKNDLKATSFFEIN